MSIKIAMRAIDGGNIKQMERQSFYVAAQKKFNLTSAFLIAIILSVLAIETSNYIISFAGLTRSVL